MTMKILYILFLWAEIFILYLFSKIKHFEKLKISNITLWLSMGHDIHFITKFQNHGKEHEHELLWINRPPLAAISNNYIYSSLRDGFIN